MSVSEEKFPHIYLSGDNFEAGKQHGHKLKQQIESSYDIYKRFLFFDLPDDTLAELGKRFLESFAGFSDEYVTEIEGIAAGASAEPWQIAVLNARNELHHFMKGRSIANECTALFIPGCGILAQNWDWAQEFESLAVVVSRERPDGRKSLQFTEPGVLGKIGFNDAGLGVCLNFLPGRRNRIGVPVHLLLRSVLDASSIDEALDRIQNAKSCSFSNILLGDRTGNYFDIELYERSKTKVKYPDKIPFHTNHYLEGPGANLTHSADQVEEELYENSITRFKRVNYLLSQHGNGNIETVKQILDDRSDGEHSICSDYKYIMGAYIGTVGSIVMDLKKLEMHISKGNQTQHAYEVIAM